MMFIWIFQCVNYVIITCKLIPWTLESMRSLREIGLSWENISWCKSRKSPVFVATVAHDLGTFMTSKTYENFCGHSPRCQLQILCFEFSKIRPFRCLKKSKTGLCARLPEENPTSKHSVHFQMGALMTLKNCEIYRDIPQDFSNNFHV